MVAGVAKVAVLLLSCLAASGSLEVLAEAVLRTIEAMNRKVALVCMAGPSEGGVASANVTLCSSMGRSTTVCIPDTLKIVSALRTTYRFSRSQSRYPKLPSGPYPRKMHYHDLDSSF